MGQGVLLRIKQQLEIGLLILLEIFLHHFLAVVDLLPVWLHHRQGVLQAVFDVFRIILRVRGLLIHNRLDLRILGRLDGQTAVVDQTISLLGGIALHLLQILDHLFNRGVHIIGIDRRGAGALIRRLDPLVYVILQSLVILLLADMLLSEHGVQDPLAALRVVIRVADGIILAGVLSNGRDSRRLRDGQIADVLIKIPVGRRLDAQGILSQVDGVQVSLQDLLLGHDLLQLNRQILLLKLTFHLLHERILAHEIEDAVFQQLLGDGAGALGLLEAAGHHSHARAQDTPQVNAVVLVETLVLNIDERPLDILGNVLDVHPDPVGAGCDQLCHRVPVRVQHDGLIAPGDYCGAVNIGRVVNDALHDSHARADADDAHRQDTDQKCLYKDYACFFLYLCSFGVHGLLLFRSSAFSIIHLRSSSTSFHYNKNFPRNKGKFEISQFYQHFLRILHLPPVDSGRRFILY